MVTGCSSGSSAGAGTADSKALKQLKLAVDTSRGVRSLTASLSVHSLGSTTGKVTGTIQMQLKPATLIDAKFDVAQANSPKIHLDEILTGDAIYFRNPAFSKTSGKPWVRAKISELSSKSGISIGSLLQNMESSNPLDQARLFTASENVRVVGARSVGGVATTEYAGSYTPKAAYKSLPPHLRKLIGPMLRSIGTRPVSFHVWIDGQHMIKKADDTASVRGQTVTTTFLVTSVNQPVKVTLPKAADIAPLPKV